MPDLTLPQMIFLAAIVLYTLATSFTDIRSRKIPNVLTAPMCLAGFVYQGVCFGAPGLVNGLLGFAVGFGILFVLWMIGSAGGGDVKLMGGLSVWLGAPLTLRVLLCSLIFVMLGTATMVLYSLVFRGVSSTRRQLQQKKATGGAANADRPTQQKRRVMAFAVPVALATWCVLMISRTLW
jgi:prepilin peptidase CpaA